MSTELVNPDLIFIDQDFPNSEACIEFIGQKMVEANLATPEYTQAMLEVLHNYKGIIVLDDGIALAHARPEKGGLADGLVFVQLKHPLDFYNSDFPEVKFVVGVVTTGSDNHLKTMRWLVNLIEDEIQHQNFQSKAELLEFLRVEK